MGKVGQVNSDAALIGLISNPRSTRNRHQLPDIRAFVARHANIFHVELKDISDLPEALRLMALARPRVLVVNGGDGTVQATLTALVHARPFGDDPPPVAVLPNGKTNLIANDLGISGAPLKALARILELAPGELQRHTVERCLIALDDGKRAWPVLGMFMGGAGLMEGILYCRSKIYPLGLPEPLSHALAFFILVGSILLGRRLGFGDGRLKISVRRAGALEGNFFLVMVTTLEKLVLGVRQATSGIGGTLKIMCLENRRMPILRTALAIIFGRLEKAGVQGLHLRRGDEIRLEGSNPSVILDGELFEAAPGKPLILRPTAPQRFLSLAAA